MLRHKDIGSLIKNRLFSGIEASKLKMKLRQNNFLSFREGDIIFQKGDASESIYLVLEGEVKVKVYSPGTGVSIYRKGRDDFFGEIELFEKAPRNSSAIANMDCILYTLSRKEVYELVSANKIIKKNLSGEEPESESTITEELEESKAVEDQEESIAAEYQEDIQPINEAENADESTFLENELNEIPADDKELDLSNLDFNDDTSLSADQFIANDISISSITEESDVYNNIEDKIDEELTEGIFSKALDSELDMPDKLFHEESELDTTETNHEDLESTYSEPKIDAENEAMPVHEDFIDYKKIFQSAKKISSGTDLETTVRSTIEALIELFDAQIIRIFIAEKDTHELWSYPFMDNSEGIKKVKFGEGLIGSAAIENKIINLNEPLTDARFNTQIDTVENIFIEDMILFPVFNEDNNLTAVVQMINSGKNGFTSIDIEIFSILASNISTAIENVKGIPETVNENKPEEVHEEKAKSVEDENIYFSKATEFLTGDIKISSALLIRYLDFIKRKSEAEEIKNASSLALQEVELILKNAVVVSDYFNGKSALKKEISDFKKTIDEILDLLVEYVESRKHKLFKKCLADVSVNIDKQAFYLACYQIVKNACDAMPQGGSIYVTCDKDDKSVIIEFKDTGSGIKEDIRDKVFEPFFSYPEDKPGLGLAVAAKIIKDHGGVLKLNPEVTEGASFVITLPAVL